MGCSRALVDWYKSEVDVMELRQMETAWLAARRARREARREARRVRRETKQLRRELRREQRRQREADLVAWNALMEPFEG